MTARPAGPAGKNTVLVIGGPTASGKSGLALAVAAARGGTIINADSMQVYDGLPILTAQPTAAEKEQIPHRLYAALPPEEMCTAARWATMALSETRAALADGRLPIIVGGTGFYIKTLLEGISPIPDVPASFRQEAVVLHQDIGTPAFYAELAKRDPETAAKLDPANPQRLMRAWEVLAATGKGLAAWQAAPRVPPPADLAFFTVTVLPPREALYAACNGRFEKMLERGALKEAKEFEAADGMALSKALGYPELRAHLDGEIPLTEAAARAQQSTRNYAKRQTTWFRHQIKADLVLENPDPTELLTLLSD